MKILDNRVVKDLIKYYKTPVRLLPIGLALQLLYKISFGINEYVAITFGLLSILVLGVFALGLIYMTIIMFGDDFKKETT